MLERNILFTSNWCKNYWNCLTLPVIDVFFWYYKNTLYLITFRILIINLITVKNPHSHFITTYMWGPCDVLSSVWQWGLLPCYVSYVFSSEITRVNWTKPGRIVHCINIFFYFPCIWNFNMAAIAMKRPYE